MTAATPAQYFDAIYSDDDPFGYRERWYEARKRSLLLASLPAARFADAWEIGCSNGELTAALAPRCDRLLATDLSARAVALATSRTQGLAHVRARQARHPDDWPDGRFDLIVFSEVGYYLDAATLSRMAARLRASLRDGGVLVACHWLAPFREAPLSGRDVHRLLRRRLALPRLFAYADGDLRLEGWGGGGRSVAQRAGLR
ncbi:nodulation S family protein [Luteimonas sp. BDR2-5]|uniref:class I SAM-dependent DNA methyltransferase n=1 Tax=Proluteimonas luteida TaxID=2878685 RepID=UPI001E48A0BB|nr:class I SAM-dependent methyltransferase [Luteimonas sp. BDR2-5]MCD9028131.1 nodulation S family protein [Luteimonas sp. BDR2-5]